MIFLAFFVIDHSVPLATYWQDVNLRVILEKRPRTLVVDPYCGPGDRPWTEDELRTLREHGVKPVAYLSLATVGEHQGDLYRLARKRGLLGRPDPEWPGDHAVRFWERAWLDALRAKLKELRDLGYEGVFIDVVDPWSRDWYVEWFHRETGGDVDGLKGRSYRALEGLLRTARDLGLRVYVNAGDAVFDRKLAELKDRYGFGVVVENVVADDEGRPTPGNVFEAKLRALERLGDGVYVFEYGIDPERERNRLTGLFSRTDVEEVYITSPDHDRLGKAAVPPTALLKRSDSTMGRLLKLLVA
ncbi:endo alpha-1,4 polygalactosaminidase [Methanopyrus kandleri]